MNTYTFDKYDVEQKVLDFMRDNDAEPIDTDQNLHLDGKIHRYTIQGDKRSKKDGAYCIFTDNWPAGWIQNWKNGCSISWCYKRNDLNDNGRNYFTDEKYKEAVELSRKHQQELIEKREKEQADAADKARIRADMFPEAKPNFEYLIKKKVFKFGNMRFDESQDAIVLPLTDIDGNVKSLQYIFKDGTKRFYHDAPTKGLFYGIATDVIAKDTQHKLPILVCEGYATGATLHELTNFPVFVAMNCHNLLPVTEAIKAKYPDNKIIIMADNDHKTKGNPGVTEARKVCRKLKANVSYLAPGFTDDQDGTDWNDYYVIYRNSSTQEGLKNEILLALLTPEQKAKRQKVISEVEHIDAQSLRNKQFPPIKWAVEGFLPSGLSILAGGPKVGKSILSLHLSLAVCTGGYAFGKILVKQGDVLYLALEDTQRRLKERIEGSDIDDTIDLSRLQLATFVPRQHEGGMEYIRAWLETHSQARLVIIDTLQRFRKQLSGKNSMYSEDYDVVADIKKLADEFDVPFLVIHHLKKAFAEDWLNEISGSQGIAGAADTIFSLKRARTENGGILHRTGRDVEEKDFEMELDQYSWILKGEAGLFTMPEWKHKILSFLKEHNSVTPMELSQALGFELNTAQQYLRRLSKENTIQKIGYGSYALKEE